MGTRSALVGVVMAMALHASTVMAGGLIGDGLRGLGLGGAGDAIDHAHEQLKNAVPPYKAFEEGASGAVRHGAGELAGESLGPALAAAIRASRSDAISAGVQPIPTDIDEALRAYFPPDVLASVRYRVGQGNELSLQANSFRFGDRVAITLDDVIVFRSVSDVGNLRLWAHELGHVLQYRNGGIEDFAKRYVKHFGHMENEADQVADAFVVAYNAVARGGGQGGWQGGGSQGGGVLVTDRCQINGVDVAVYSTGQVSPNGQVRFPAAHPGCAFDILGQQGAYCVNRADGSVLRQNAQGWYPVGRCTHVAG